MRSPDKAGQSYDFLQSGDIHSRWLSDYLNPDIDRFYDLAFDHIVAKLNLTADSSILDAGCGRCYHTARLVRRCDGRVVAVDFSDAALSAAQRTVASAGIESRVRLLKGDLTALQFKSEFFDAVISWGVLMHIPQLDTGLRELVRVLRPGGYLVLSENNMASLDARVRLAPMRALNAVVGKKNATAARTDWGLEVWHSFETGGLMDRLTDMNYLIGFLAQQGLALAERRAGQFSEGYVNVASQSVKRVFHRMNEWYFRLGLSPSLAHGNILLFRKRERQ